MIRPKVGKPSKAEEKAAYVLATERDDNTCQRCLKHCGPGTSRDHRQDRSLGGLTLASNLQVLGGTGTTGCHGWKTDHPKAALEQGWAVPGWADPLEYPAPRWIFSQGFWHLGWVLYDNDGDWVEISDGVAMRRMRRADS
jgi:hypothetical protein